MKRSLAWSLWWRFVRAGSPAPHGACLGRPGRARAGAAQVSRVHSTSAWIPLASLEGMRE